MKKFIVAVMLLATVAAPLFSQDAEDAETVSATISEWKEGDAYTLVSDANVREKATVQSNVITKLPIGAAIKVEEVMTDSFTLNGFKAPWCRISAENGAKKGFLWGGFIATVVLKMPKMYDQTGETMLLGGVSAWNEKDHKMTLQLRATKNAKELARLDFTSAGDLGYTCTLTLENGGNFNGVQNTLTFTTGYPACGYPWSDNLVFLTKSNKLIKVLETVSMSDAGAFYSRQSYILPNDRGGINNHVIFTDDSASMEEKGNDYVMKDQKYKLMLYKWDGAKLVRVPKI